MASYNSYSSPRWVNSLQDRQQQRQGDMGEGNTVLQRRRSQRGAYMGSQETDFLMASIVSDAEAVTAATAGTAATDPMTTSQTGSGDPYGSSSNNVPQSPISGLSQMLDVAGRRSANSVVNVRQQPSADTLKAFLDGLPTLDHCSLRTTAVVGEHGYGACNDATKANNANENTKDDEREAMLHATMKNNATQSTTPTVAGAKSSRKQHPSLVSQLPAVAVSSLLNLMMAIPFGVSYFPIGWSSGDAAAAAQGEVDSDGVNGSFPLPGKEALGIRMCLFSTLIGQIIMTFASRFDNCICFQMVENVPFFHTLAKIVLANQGYGIESLSTLFFLFGSSSILVGALFYVLGRLDLGRIVYFFPNHVLVGCIAGIGVFIVVSAVEVTTDTGFSWDLTGLKGIIDNFRLLGVVLLFETTLRLLIWKTKSRIPLLAPIFFCSIPFVFYACLWVFRIKLTTAKEAGYFFPASSSDEDANQSMIERAFSLHTLDLLRVVDLRTISWKAVYDSLGTMVALAAFSLIHVPINIPAFSISMDIDTDMNAELIAHGYSNFAAGMFGALPNYMTYSSSLLYAKSNGGGKIGSLLVSFFTFVFFLFGPEIATFIPRCMAGTLLLHIGLDLVLEGVVDSYDSYDRLEYGGIWLITIAMTTMGMTAGLLAGIFAALSVYAAQSITYMNPIRKVVSATSLLSSVWTRPATELAILNDEFTGRSRVLLVQLQGHLFFGNVSQLTDTVRTLLTERHGTDLEPFIVILDFTLVLGLDSSAAHAVAKMNTSMHRRFNVAATVFVAGRQDGFPCEYALSEALAKQAGKGGLDELDEGLTNSLASIGNPNYLRNLVCDNLDEALIFAEDVLIVRQDPSLLKHDREVVEPTGYLTLGEERQLAVQQLANLFPRNDEVSSAVKLLFSFFVREEYCAQQIIWKQGAGSICAKLIVRGDLIAYSESGPNTTTDAERVPTGNIVGELGLVQGMNRLSTLKCISDKAVLYSLSLQSWEEIKKRHSFAAVYFEEIVIRYLSSRAQHVTRILETRCLPV